MKQNVMLTSASLLSILFVTFHLADDIIRGMEPGTVVDLAAVPIFVVWLYGTLVLAERRSGYVIILLGSLLGLVVPVIHMMGKGVGVGGNIAKSSGAFFFVWTLIALGVTALFSVILSARTVDPTLGPAVVQQPKHGKARRTAELIGVDRVLPATPAQHKQDARASGAARRVIFTGDLPRVQSAIVVG